MALLLQALRANAVVVLFHQCVSLHIKRLVLLKLIAFCSQFESEEWFVRAFCQLARSKTFESLLDSFWINVCILVPCGGRFEAFAQIVDADLFSIKAASENAIDKEPRGKGHTLVDSIGGHHLIPSFDVGPFDVFLLSKISLLVLTRQVHALVPT